MVSKRTEWIQRHQTAAHFVLTCAFSWGLLNDEEAT